MPKLEVAKRSGKVICPTCGCKSRPSKVWFCPQCGEGRIAGVLRIARIATNTQPIITEPELTYKQWLAQTNREPSAKAWDDFVMRRYMV